MGKSKQIRNYLLDFFQVVLLLLFALRKLSHIFTKQAHYTGLEVGLCPHTRTRAHFLGSPGHTGSKEKRASKLKHR